MSTVLQMLVICQTKIETVLLKGSGQYLLIQELYKALLSGWEATMLKSHLFISLQQQQQKKTAKTTTTTSIEQWKNECLIIFFKKINTKFIFMMNYLIRITSSMSEPRWQSWQHVRFTIKS